MIKNEKNQQGLAALLFLLVMSAFVVLLLAITQSRLLVALKRSQSSTDTLVATYQAESEANDFLARLEGGYLNDDDFPIDISKSIGDTTLEIVGTAEGDRQLLTVTTSRSFAVSKIQAERYVQSIKEVNNVDIILSLDCTSSMDARVNDPYKTGGGNTRFAHQEEAAASFVDKISKLEDASKFRVGVMVYGLDSKWLTYRGMEVKPNSELSLFDIKDAIEQGFGDVRSESPACDGIMDATSVGTAYSASHQWFEENAEEGIKQIEVVITDGLPNSRIPNASCTPDVFCPAFPIDSNGTNVCKSNAYGWTCYQGDTYENGPFGEDNFSDTAYSTCEPLGKDFLKCALSTPEDGGVRNPDVDAYAVTIYDNPPGDVVAIFNSYATTGGYFNAKRADQLKNILNTVLNEILRDRTVITFRRLIPSTD